MKHILSFLLLAGILSVSLYGKTNQSAHQYTFTIHIGAFVKAQSSDFAGIKPYGFLYAQRINNLLQIYMGDYPTEGQAMAVLERVKRHGYADAFVTRRDLSGRADRRVIQLATKPWSDDIDWAHYSTAGPLLVLLEGKLVKILTGPFASVAESNQQLKRIRAAGFRDAFAKKVNEVLLHPVTEFEAGVPLDARITSLAEATPPPQQPSSSSDLLMVPPKPKKQQPPATTQPPKKDVLTARDAAIPKSYDVVVPPQSKSIAKPVVANEATIAPPKTRGKVKRNSAYELQKIFKNEGVYSKSLDGYYGPGTAAGWTALQQSNEQMKKYLLLAKHQEKTSLKPSGSTLWQHIYMMGDNSQKAIAGLKNSNSPIAKAYRAYAAFAKSGPSKEVNDLMNAAIKQAFANKNLQNKPPFNYDATYDYKQLGQLLLHLRYVQNTTAPNLETPYWLYVKHPKEVQAAFEPTEDQSDFPYPVQDSRPLFDWPELDLLETILADLNTKADKSPSPAAYHLRSRLLLAPKPLSVEHYKAISQWHKNLWKKMDEWGDSDALHGKLLLPLKASYFQTLVRLEDYFMDKGFDARMATGLGLSVMKTWVEDTLDQY